MSSPSNISRTLLPELFQNAPPDPNAKSNENKENAPQQSNCDNQHVEKASNTPAIGMQQTPPQHASQCDIERSANESHNTSYAQQQNTITPADPKEISKDDLDCLHKLIRLNPTLVARIVVESAPAALAQVLNQDQHMEAIVNATGEKTEQDKICRLAMQASGNIMTVERCAFAKNKAMISYTCWDHLKKCFPKIYGLANSTKIRSLLDAQIKPVLKDIQNPKGTIANTWQTITKALYHPDVLSFMKANGYIVIKFSADASDTGKGEKGVDKMVTGAYISITSRPTVNPKTNPSLLHRANSYLHLHPIAIIAGKDTTENIQGALKEFKFSMDFAFRWGHPDFVGIPIIGSGGMDIFFQQNLNNVRPPYCQVCKQPHHDQCNGRKLVTQDMLRTKDGARNDGRAYKKALTECLTSIVEEKLANKREANVVEDAVEDAAGRSTEDEDSNEAPGLTNREYKAALRKAKKVATRM